MTSIIKSLIKYTFYTAVLTIGVGLMFLYHTKPSGALMQFLEYTNIVDDYVFFKILRGTNETYIGVANRWIKME